MKRMNNRKIGALLLTLILAVQLAVPGFAAEDTDTYYISDADGLVALAQYCSLNTWSVGKTVVLQGDISLEGVDFTPIPTFGGTFDGGGYTISGLGVYDSFTPSGLFGVLQSTAVVKNLNVSGTVSPDGDGSMTGGIVGENNGMLLGCTFTGTVVGSDSVGGIAGCNGLTGKIVNCNAGGNVTGDRMTGGIAGCNLGIINACDNTAYVNTTSVDRSVDPSDLNLDFLTDLSKLSTLDTSNATNDTGGIAGYSSGVVESCANSATVGYPHFGYNVGGIIGRSCGYVRACENAGQIYGRKDVGGIVGQMEPYISKDLSESLLAQLQGQLEELNTMLNQAMDDAEEGGSVLSDRLNKMADCVAGAAGAASNIGIYGTVSTTVDGSAETGGSGSVTVDPSDVTSSAGAGSGGSLSVEITPSSGSVEGGSGIGAEISAGLTEGSVSGEGDASASGSLNAQTQITMTTSLGGLSSSLYGLSSQMRLLNGEVTDLSGVLGEDIRAINEQINAISDTAFEMILWDGEEDVIIDLSDIDINLITLGKTVDCENMGWVDGDINVGGITGAMAMEYELDPEDDISAAMDNTTRRKYEVKAVIQECVNTGTVTAKRNYAGGICGKMDLGLIAQAESYGTVRSESGNYVGGIAGITSSTVRHSFAKCTLSGGKYVGGIVGSGVTEDLGGTSSTVAGCYSLVNITDYDQYAGAISGDKAGTYLENYFVSDTLAGINRMSYTGEAEPVNYGDLLQIFTRQEAEAVTEEEETEEEVKETEETEEEEDGSEESEEALPEETAAIDASPIGDLPDEFKKFTLTFEADGEVLGKEIFDYGASFDDSVFPELPQKKGYYACWDTTDLSNLKFDTVVTAVYTQYVTALASEDERGSGRSVFFVEGEFDDVDVLTVDPVAKTPSELDCLADGFWDTLSKCFTSVDLSREVVEQWEVSIPDDGLAKHTVRYLSPDGDTEHMDLYVRQGGSWEKAECESVGSYLCFEVESRNVEIAAVSTMPIWWVWLIPLGLFILLVALILSIWKKRKKGNGSPVEQEQPDVEDPIMQRVLETEAELARVRAEMERMRSGQDPREEEAEPEEQEEELDPEEEQEAETPEPFEDPLESAPVQGGVGVLTQVSPEKKKTRRWLVGLSIGVAVLVIAAALFLFFRSGLKAGLEAYRLLEEYAQQEAFSMELDVEAELGDVSGDFTATVARTDLEGHSVTCIQQDGISLYYADGVVFTENGSGFQISQTSTDYSQLLDLSLEMFEKVEITEKKGVYSITADGEDAQELLKLLIPGTAEWICDDLSVEVELETKNKELSKLCFSSKGKLSDEDKTKFQVEAELSRKEAGKTPKIPEVVKNAIVDEDYEADQIFSEELSQLVQAWMELLGRETVGADVSLDADCGPLTVNEQLELWISQQEEAAITCLRKNGFSLYFTDGAICDQDGNALSRSEQPLVESAQLLEIAYQVCMNAEFDYSNGVYSMSLDRDAMESIAYAIVPDAKTMDVEFSSGKVQVTVKNGSIESIAFACDGSVQVVITDVPVSIGARIQLRKDVSGFAVPEKVTQALAEK